MTEEPISTGGDHAEEVDEIVYATEDPEGETPVFAHTLADALPYSLLPWSSLERLLKRVATRVLGWDQVRVYGTPGQTQYGIDIIGIQPDGTYGAIQSKHYKSFDETDLRRAVAAYRPDKLPIKGITRLIVATAVGTNRRQIIDVLDELRPSHQVILEFWDASNLDESLQRHADIVATFFGMDAAQQFCGYAPKLVEPPHPERALVATNVARGPENLPVVVAALARAQRPHVDPAEAASAYSEAQQVLRQANFAAHARVLDADRIDALLQAGRHRDAVVSLAEAFWDAVNVAELDQADLHARRLQDLRTRPTPAQPGNAKSFSPEEVDSEAVTNTDVAIATDSAQPVASTGSDPQDQATTDTSDEAEDAEVHFVEQLTQIVLIAHAVARTPAGSIESICPGLDLVGLVAAFETDQVMCEQVGRLAVLVAQTALNDPTDDWAEREVDQLRAASALLADLEQPGAMVESIRYALAIEVADAAQDWNNLRLQARKRLLDRDVIANLEARYAMANALRGHFEEADLGWLDAIEQACLDGHYSDAAEWVFARRNTLLATHLWPTQDPNTFYRTAHALQHLGGGPRQAVIRRTADRATDNALNEKTRAAALGARDYARRAYAIGSWRQYGHASILLARAYTDSGRHLDAVTRLITAGETDKAVRAARAATNTWLDVTPLMGSGSPRTQTVSFRVLAVQGDLLPDERVADVEDVTLTVVRTVLGPTPTGSGFDPPFLAALRVLGAIATRLRPETASELIDLLQPSVERNPGHYHHSDEWHVQIMAGIADSHPDLREQALNQLVGLGVTDTGASTYVTRHALHVLADHLDVVDPLLQRLIEQQHPQAARLRARIAPGEQDTFSDEAMEAARQRLLAPPDTTPGVHVVGSQLGDDAVVVQHLPVPQRLELVKALISHSQAEPPPVYDVTEYLNAATSLTNDFDAQPELFQLVLKLATQEPSAPAMPMPTSPLSAFRVTGFETDPRPAAALLAARLASTDDERGQAQETCLRLLLWNGENASTLTFAIWEAFGSDIATILPMLAAQPTSTFRSLAAEAWAHYGSEDHYVGERLAFDSEPAVRRILARTLARIRREGTLGKPNERVLSILESDPLHSVRTLVQNSVAPQ